MLGIIGKVNFQGTAYESIKKQTYQNCLPFITRDIVVFFPIIFYTNNNQS